MKDGLLWYGYVNNNPMGFVDPTGLQVVSPTTGVWVDTDTGERVNEDGSPYDSDTGSGGNGDGNDESHDPDDPQGPPDGATQDENGTWWVPFDKMSEFECWFGNRTGTVRYFNPT